MNLNLNVKGLRRFYKKIKIDNDCWIWQGSCTSEINRETPTFHLENQKIQARRLSYLIHFSEMPKEYITNSCGNDLCVNPLHLIDIADNKIIKRYKTINKNPIDDKLVRKVIKMYNSGFTLVDISKKLDIAYPTICLIKKIANYCKDGKLKLENFKD